MIKLPGLIDVHVHMREPGALHKEDWSTGTAAALAGGFTAVLAMPNTNPPITDEKTFEQIEITASEKAVSDYAHYIGAGPDNAEQLADISVRTAGLKMYLDQTYGPLRLDDITLWMEHFEHWPADLPIVAHAESRTMAAVIFIAELFNRPVHIAHVSLREEILVIRKAKERGIKVTCEVAPHHLFLSKEDIQELGPGRSEVRPRLATPMDQNALWENMDVIDIFATDHAPHTKEEKDGPNPPPGFPGLETALPLFLTAVHENRISLDDVIKRFVENPRQIFNLPKQESTWIEVDPDIKWKIRAENLHSRCGWTPFEGRQVTGCIKKVVMRGQEVFKEDQVLVDPGFGQNLK